MTVLPITPERIQAMAERRLRRVRLAGQWPDALGGERPDRPDRLVLPFAETLLYAFRDMVGPPARVRQHNDDGSIVVHLPPGPRGEAMAARTAAWLQAVGDYVALRDCLDLSFALDYDRPGGLPGRERTRVGRLRWVAKPLDGLADSGVLLAAERLAEDMLAFLEQVRCYRGVEVVTAPPPADPGKGYHLPAHLAATLARRLDVADGTAALRTVRPRRPTKDCPLYDKLRNLNGSIRVEPGLVAGRTVLLVDDIYQSGISLNHAAMLLQQAGAARVFGLVCEKTTTDTDNTAPARQPPQHAAEELRAAASDEVPGCRSGSG